MPGARRERSSGDVRFQQLPRHDKNLSAPAVFKTLSGGYKSGFFFAHQNSLLKYPHETAEDELTSSYLSEYSCFDTDSIFSIGSQRS